MSFSLPENFNRYKLMKRLSSSSLLFPLTLSLLLGGTGFWLNRATDIQIEDIELNPNEPQYVLSDISAARFDDKGLLKDNLTAQTAQMYPKSDEIIFQKPTATVRENGKPLYNLVSDNGVYHTKEKWADFSGSVLITHFDANGGITGQMTSPTLHIDNIGANTQLPKLDNTAPTQRIKTVIYDVENIKTH